MLLTWELDRPIRHSPINVLFPTASQTARRLQKRDHWSMSSLLLQLSQHDALMLLNLKSETQLCCAAWNYVSTWIKHGACSKQPCWNQKFTFYTTLGIIEDTSDGKTAQLQSWCSCLCLHPMTSLERNIFIRINYGFKNNKLLFFKQRKKRHTTCQRTQLVKWILTMQSGSAR